MQTKAALAQEAEEVQISQQRDRTVIQARDSQIRELRRDELLIILLILETEA